MPSCFAQLRLVLESLAEALIIDYRYGFGDEGVYREVHGYMHGPDGERSERCIEMCKELPLYRKYILWRRIRGRKSATRVFMEQLAIIIGEENAEKVISLWSIYTYAPIKREQIMKLIQYSGHVHKSSVQ